MMGRQLENGLVPASLYSFIISSDWRWRSFLYRSWMAFIFGWIACMARVALICFTKSGIRQIRMTTTIEAMARPQAQPPFGSKTWLYSEWNWTMIQDTAVYKGLRKEKVTGQAPWTLESAPQGQWSPGPLGPDRRGA